MRIMTNPFFVPWSAVQLPFLKLIVILEFTNSSLPSEAYKLEFIEAI